MTIATATRLGPYEILAPLGAGGMGEVYRATDTRLGRVVALKVLPGDFLESEERKRRFEKEAKLLASLNHPNVAVLYSFEEIEGRHVLTMELLEGESLRKLLLHRTPTVRQVLWWALQAAQGLSAAHAKGIVHRDIKPENLFLTFDGRLKILDFGLAKLTAQTPAETEAATESGLSVPGVIVGTVAYMSPEQIEAEGLDPRSDVFSLGVVLYELLAREHPFRRPTVPATLAAIVHDPPLALSARMPEVLPGVDRIVRKCLEKRREERYQSAQELATALETVLEGGRSSASLTDVEEKSPYPGLSSFTEADAGRFFGREEEVAALWRKLHDRKLLAVIGPSGAGKTSFARAGVIPARPEGWSAIVATPGNAPLRGLARALGPQLASDPEALRRLADFEDGDTSYELLFRWRKSHDNVLLVVDQFEELFTLNPPASQARFATLLGRLTSDADVHVLLSLRDDFLMRCHGQNALAPVFEALTPLGAMSREGLRRALAEPAARRGYRFEDDALVDEMVGAVEGARGALPLLAFAVARLWEGRDADRKLLTREAYGRIGGVAGALAQHAEESMDRIGGGMEPTVRDLFRNLTTAQGTRAVLDREELLSALPDRTAAEAVLGKLVDARLLTSWETAETAGQPAHDRVEIVHESLLSAWPRLVRWQTQDADGAQLRDQLRQAAHLWQERGKAEDLLWTGSTYLDYRVWRGRYPGKLSSLEEDFAESMAAVADGKKRRRRAVVGFVGVALVAMAGVMALLWNRARIHAIGAEAAKLLAMAQLDVEVDPTAALAYATKSVELDDTQAARFFALRLLQNTPVANIVGDNASHAAFSANGEWLAAMQGNNVLLLNQDGRKPVTHSPGEFAPRTLKGLAFGPDGKTVTVAFHDEARVLSVPDGRASGRVKYEEAVDELLIPCGVAVKWEGNRWTFFGRPWNGGEQRLIGALELSEPLHGVDFARDFSVMAFGVGRKLYLKSPAQWDLPPRLLGEHPAPISCLSFSGDRRRLAAVDKSGEIRVWDPASGSTRPLRVLPAPAVATAAGNNMVWYGTARWIMSDTLVGGHGVLRLWDLTAPPGAEPLVLRSRTASLELWAMDPLNRGCTALESDSNRRLFWRLPRSQPRIFEGREGEILSVAFTADGTTLVAAAYQGEVRAWPLSAEAAEPFRTLAKANDFPARMSAASARREILVGSRRGRVQLMPVDGGEPRELAGLPRKSPPVVALSPDGRRAAAALSAGPAKGKRIHIWDLETGAVRVLEPVPDADDGAKGGFWGLSFVDNDRIVASVVGNGLMLFDLLDGKGKVLSAAIDGGLAVGRSGRVGVGLACDGKNPWCELLRFGLDGSAPVPLPYRAKVGLGGLAVDPTATLVASKGPEDSVQVGPISGGEPYLLFGHSGDVNALSFSPDGKWLASAGDDHTVRLWPVPDVTKVPPHRRSKEEFLGTLRTFTNVRAVPDPKAPKGWRLEAGPFSGWQTEPHW